MQNKKEQWTVLKRLMSYLKPYGLLTFLALSFLPSDDGHQKCHSPCGFPLSLTSISAILTKLL